MILNFLQSTYLKSSCLFVHFPFSTIESAWQRGLLIFTIHHTEFITVPNSSDLFHKWLLNSELIRITRSVSISPWDDMGFLNYFNWRITTLHIVTVFAIHQHELATGTCGPYILYPSLPSLFLWVVPEHCLWVPCFMHRTCTGHLFYIW